MTQLIDIKVVPSSGKNKWALDKSGKIKCYLKSPPEDGKANKELISILSKLLNIPQLNIFIVKGLTSRNKTIKISKEISREEFLKLVGLQELEPKQTNLSIF